MTSEIGRGPSRVATSVSPVKHPAVISLPPRRPRRLGGGASPLEGRARHSGHDGGRDGEPQVQVGDDQVEGCIADVRVPIRADALDVGEAEPPRVAARHVERGTAFPVLYVQTQDPQTVQNGTAFQLLGLPVIVTNHIPNASGKARVGLVDFSRVAVVRDNDSEVYVAEDTLANYDTKAIRVTARFDVALLQPKAVTLLTAA